MTSCKSFRARSLAFARGEGCGPSVLRDSVEGNKEEEVIVKLRAPMWYLPKALQCLSQRVYVGSENESFAQSFDVGLCANYCGGDTCQWKLGSIVESIGRRLPLRNEVFLQ
ncbi:hypothetical protein L3X38_018746 [Prunus dulcis]|uniref:Uncharacterized protein n=1 Tax=Prunus dulcis TaxID=3755 RepID=A0AAD4ZBF0_PRUDU|nr:hypothetical protein L3X38_018746 [Prunus dulcis]